MAGDKLVFAFTSRVVRIDQGMPYHALPVPDRAAVAWKKAKIRRLVGAVNGHAVKRALQSHRDGDSFIIVNRDFMQEAGLALHAPARVELKPDPEPTRLDLPEEFRLALQQDPAARQRWDTFTLGRRRSLLVYITGAKTEATRIKRSVELATKIRTHRLYGDAQKNNGGSTGAQRS